MGKAARFCKKFLGLLEQQANPIRYARKIGVRIGEGCRISGRTNWGSEPWLVTIGNHTALSFDCTFITHDGATWGFRGKPGYENIVRFGRISVGDDCFIGAKATILPGVHIGANSIIAAGAVVASSVPAGEVWGGARQATDVDPRLCRKMQVMAREIRRRIPKGKRDLPGNDGTCLRRSRSVRCGA